jgi:hypothetical protein
MKLFNTISYGESASIVKRAVVAVEFALEKRISRLKISFYKSVVSSILLSFIGLLPGIHFTVITLPLLFLGISVVLYYDLVKYQKISRKLQGVSYMSSDEEVILVSQVLRGYLDSVLWDKYDFQLSLDLSENCYVLKFLEATNED